MKRFESVYPLRPLFFRKLKNHLITLFSWSAVVIAVGAMVWILGTVLIDGLKVITPGFLLNPSKPYGIPDAGIGNAILGTLLIEPESNTQTSALYRYDMDKKRLSWFPRSKTMRSGKRTLREKSKIKHSI